MRLTAPLALALAALLPAMAACASAGENDNVVLAERVDSAGIELVINRGADRPLAGTFTPRLTLGGKDEGPESFFRVGRGRAGVDAAGNIYVLDFDAKRVVIFDSTGKHLRSLGREGLGQRRPGHVLALAARDRGRDGEDARAHQRRQSPDFPPDFSSSATSPTVTPRSTPLTMS